jgi:hypothetical protein
VHAHGEGKKGSPAKVPIMRKRVSDAAEGLDAGPR